MAQASLTKSVVVSGIHTAPSILYSSQACMHKLTKLRNLYAPNMAVGGTIGESICSDTNDSCTVAVYQCVGCSTDFQLGCIRHSPSIVNNSSKLKC